MSERAIVPEGQGGYAAVIPWRPGVSLPALVQGRSALEARALVADLKASLEYELVADPDNYEALVLLGELNLRVGLSSEAQALLYRASLQQPPSWAAFQRTSFLLRRAEEQQQRAFDRVAGAAPPRFVRRLAAGAVAKFDSAVRKRTAARKVSP